MLYSNLQKQFLELKKSDKLNTSYPINPLDWKSYKKNDIQFLFEQTYNNLIIMFDKKLNKIYTIYSESAFKGEFYGFRCIWNDY